MSVSIDKGLFGIETRRGYEQRLRERLRCLEGVRLSPFTYSPFTLTTTQMFSNLRPRLSNHPPKPTFLFPPPPHPDSFSSNKPPRQITSFLITNAQSNPNPKEPAATTKTTDSPTPSGQAPDAGFVGCCHSCSTTTGRARRVSRRLIRRTVRITSWTRLYRLTPTLRTT